MTKSQERAVARIKREVQEHAKTDRYEVKRFDIMEMEWGTVEVLAETGLINDEDDPIARCFLRDRAQIFIGPRGGMHYYASRQHKNGKFTHSTKTYKTFFRACLDQR